MGLKSVNQNLTVWVSDLSGPQTYLATAGPTSMTATGISFEDEAGVGTATAPTTGKYTIVYKDKTGEIHRSPVINADKDTVTSKTMSYEAETLKVSDLTIPTTIIAGESYIVSVEVFNFGGFVGARNTQFYYGTHTAVAGDTPTTIASALADSLNLAFNRQYKPVAAATNVADLLKVSALDQPYTEKIYSGKGVDFITRLSDPKSIAVLEDATSVGPKPGQGTYKIVANAEAFYASYNEDYVSDGGNYPIIGSPTLAATAGATYDTTTIVVEQTTRRSPVETNRLVIETYFKN